MAKRAERTYSPREVARKLDYRLDYIYRMLADGTLRGEQLGEGMPWRVSESALKEFQQKRDAKKHQPQSITREVQGAIRRGKL